MTIREYDQAFGRGPAPTRIARYARSRMRRTMSLVFLTVVVAACSPNEATTTTAASTEAPPTSRATTTQAPQIVTTTSSSVSSTSSLPSSPCFEGDRPFATGDVISAFGGASGDAAQISEIRAARHPECERVVVDLLTADGAPAGSIGLTGVEYNEVAGIIRINLPADITRSAITDLLIDGDLVRRAYVVRTQQDRLAVDIHVVPGAAIALRAFEVDAPSRVVVDLRPDDQATRPAGAYIGTRVVVTDVAATGPSLRIRGYARTRESAVAAYVYSDREADPIRVAESSAVQWSGAWGEFALTLRDLPTMQLEIYVGDDPGDSEGVWLDADLTPTSPPPGA